MQFAGAMVIAGDPQVQGVADIGAELKAMVPVHFADVIDKLILAFVLVERAVALIYAEGVADVVASDGIIDVEGGQTGSVEIVTIQAGDAGVCCGTAPHTVWHVGDVVVQESEAEFINQRRAGGVRPARGNALVQRAGTAGIVGITKGRATIYESECSGRAQIETRVAIPPKKRVLFVAVIIPTRVPLVAVIRQGSASGVIVIWRHHSVHDRPGSIGQRIVFQKRLCLWAQRKTARA